MMSAQDKKIRKGLPPKTDPTCYRVKADIVIPAGTMLRSVGNNQFEAAVGYDAALVLRLSENNAAPAGFRRVVAS